MLREGGDDDDDGGGSLLPLVVVANPSELRLDALVSFCRSIHLCAFSCVVSIGIVHPFKP